MSRPTYIPFFLDDIEALEPLGDAERGRLFTALLEYGRLGATEKVSGNERFLYPMFKARIDRFYKSYDETCERNKANATDRKRPQATATDRKPNEPSEEEEEYKSEEETENKAETENAIPPTPSQGEPAFPPILQAAVTDWLTYKHEKRQDYTPIGKSKLLTQIQNSAKTYGAAAVADVITTSMASNYQGIVFDRLKTQSRSNGNPFVDMLREDGEL